MHMALPFSEDEASIEEAKTITCISDDQTDKLSLDSFFTPTVLKDDSGNTHTILVHDWENDCSVEVEGHGVITGASGNTFAIQKHDPACVRVCYASGRTVLAYHGFL